MKIKLALIAATLFAAQAAMAGDIYVGAGVGQSRLHADFDGLNVDNKDTAGKLLIGNQFNKNFGVEASYFDLGDFTASTKAGRKYASVGARGLGLDLVATLPVTERFAVLGRLGVTRTRVDGELFNDRAHKNVTEPKAGLGLQYKLTPNLALRGEYEVYRSNVKAFNTEAKSHVNMASASLVYTFGAKPVAAPIVKTTYVAPAPVAVEPTPVYTPAPAPVAEPVVEQAPVVTTKKVRE